MGLDHPALIETANGKKVTLFGLVLEVAAGLGTSKNEILDGYTPAEFWEALDWVLDRRKENIEIASKIGASALRL